MKLKSLPLGFVTLASVSAALAANASYSYNVTSCPGYTLQELKQTDTGLTAQLDLAGEACNAFGNDIQNLTIQVTYETQQRLHVKIFDAAQQQYTIPSSVVPVPDPPTTSYTNSSDLVFNYDTSPFAFWITRRSDSPGSMPLFDTRVASLPKTPIAPVNGTDNSTALDTFELVFEDQYLQVASALPQGANIYGLGEVIASSGFRRDVGGSGGPGSIQTLWNRDVADPVDQNMYGSHPIYMEHRYDEGSNTSATHGVLLFSSNGADVLLTTPENSNVSLIEYRLIGGTLDFYFFSGPSPVSVIEQYGETIGYPAWVPAWGFGYHLCKWGYDSIQALKDNVASMRNASVPLETQWNDIDLYNSVRDFTTDPVNYPADQMKAFIDELHANGQHYIPIVDAALATPQNSSDLYAPFIDGFEKDVWIMNPNGTVFVGSAWPGFTAWPDWFAPNTQDWWTQALQNWSDSGIEFDGIWLDMNEPSSFCTGSCGSGSFSQSSLTGAKRGVGNETGLDVTSPPYGIHNGNGALGASTVSTDAVHSGGYSHYDTHNMFGMMEEITTHKALQALRAGKRAFTIARSTFLSAGKWTGHWLGDNYSTWQSMYYSIQGILQFQIYQIPMVGADTCGFNGNTTEELCNRWQMLSAFVPFYRNHNTIGSSPQEPYRWASVANATRIAIAARYALLPYWQTLFANASTQGSPPMRALWYEFPNEPELFGVDRQFLIGSDILVTPVLDEGATTVDGIFPGRGTVAWRDWWTHAVVNASTSGGNTTLQAPLSTINVHIRDGSALLLHAEPGYTINETRSGPYELLVSLDKDGNAFGTAYVDDGESDPPGDSRTLSFATQGGALTISSQGSYGIAQKLESVTILGVQKPSSVSVGGQAVGNFTYLDATQELVVRNVTVDLNEGTKVTWQ
ncbi:glycoside hydrolase family 31 protein [Coniophora puteana RWD-64-598 SS2]|uniref:alpha-glucosidase n=1 Tax=Coniophora puteana (strain RWD-64-598) TaxID=741705 RepID=R7SFP0_CONPW|nr:glycoside hydrolase family 31 protein [Coniophora puteana RWD-64-598 SS2]EIW74552.1 glycoside hydrolase family 31 protein [Coniophora puteana RWD-64-598 SS2]